MNFERHFLFDAVKDEFRVWTQLAVPQLRLPNNVLNICEYGFTEILNNVIDHSGARNVIIKGEQPEGLVRFEIADDGVGVFTKLRSHFNLDSNVHALIELVKGKLTVAPEAHSGEGLFFASKMFDHFVIQSGDLSVTFEADRCSVRNEPNRQGTLVRMEIASGSDRTTEQVFNRFCDAEDLTFYKTRFHLSLAALEGNLVSRSQAKRVTARLESFSEVELDFSNVEKIGQAFADELLRVWPIAHPQTRFLVANANESVQKMILHVKGRVDLPQP